MNRHTRPTGDAPLHIKDKATSRAVRALAARRGLSLTDAVRLACEEALTKDSDRLTVMREKVRELQDQVAALPKREPAIADEKAWLDDQWGGL